MIVESGVTFADLANAFTGGRLSSIPYEGELLVEVQGGGAQTASNNADFTLQLPNGDVPINDQRVPAGPTAGELDDRRRFAYRFPAAQGSEPVLKIDINGTYSVAWRITLTP